MAVNTVNVTVGGTWTLVTALPAFVSTRGSREVEWVRASTNGEAGTLSATLQGHPLGQPLGGRTSEPAGYISLTGYLYARTVGGGSTVLAVDQG